MEIALLGDWIVMARMKKRIPTRFVEKYDIFTIACDIW
jgi:hypothetical protein